MMLNILNYPKRMCATSFRRKMFLQYSFENIVVAIMVSYQRLKIIYLHIITLMFELIKKITLIMYFTL